jgi:hypothetical protein
MTDLAPIEPAPLVRRDDSANPILAMLHSLSEKGIGKTDVEALEKITELYISVEDRNAERAFADAFAQLQSELRPVKAYRIVRNKDGSERYRFAAYEDVWQEVQPVLARHGFGVMFTYRYDGNRIFAIGTLRHRGGHAVVTEYGNRIGDGPPGNSASQVDAGARTMAQRLCLCSMLNIATDKDVDGDARDLGKRISQAEADAIEARVRAVYPGDEAQVARFLRFADANTFADILDGKLGVIESELAKHEKKTALPGPSETQPPPTAASAPAPVVSACPEPPCTFESAGDWRDAMLEAIGDRLGLDKEGAAAVFDRSLKAGKYESYLSVPLPSRAKAWAALHAGKFDHLKESSK